MPFSMVASDKPGFRLGNVGTAKLTPLVAGISIDLTDDQAIEALVNDTGSETYGALSAATDARIEADAESATGFTAPRAIGPRSIPRVKQGLKPSLIIDEQYPKLEPRYTHRILWGGGNGAGGASGRWYSWGHDGTLRFSTDRGRTWQRMYNGPTDGQFGRDGLFVKVTTDDAKLLTTFHPDSGSDPSIRRSTDVGVTWATVLGPTANVKWLGPNSIVKSPVTGYLYAGEYITVSPATLATCKIKRSTDDGATWSDWKSLSRAYDTDPDNGIMHVHGIQVDPFTNRLWVLVGDAAKKAGLYRLLADESDWEAICTNEMSGAIPPSGPGNGMWCGAVSLMFFQNYIAWANDQSYQGQLLRLARSEFGDANPTVEAVGALNSTGFYTARAKSDNSEWILSASQEGDFAGGRLDNAIHLYRVADDGATVDEIAALPTRYNPSSPSAFSWAFPIGGSLSDLRDDITWWGTNVSPGPAVADANQLGTQFAARLGWSNDLIVPPTGSRLYEEPSTAHSGFETGIAANGATLRYVGATVVPARASVLYIIEAGTKDWTGGGTPRVEIYRPGSTALAKLDGGAVDATFGSVSRRQALQAFTEPYIHRVTGLTVGEEIQFRLRNVHATVGPIDMSGYITYAWGF